MKRVLLTVATAVVTSCSTVLVGIVAAGPASAAPACATDLTGDAGGINSEPVTSRTVRADVLEVCVDADDSGFTFSLATAQPVDPGTDPGWTSPSGAVIHFQVDDDGDGGYDETFFYRAAGGRISVDRATSGECTATGRYEGGRYVAVVDRSCLADPASLRVAAYVNYPEDPRTAGGTTWYDFTELSAPLATGYDLLVRRLAGADRWQTAAAIARATYPGGADPLVARGDDFPDALTSVNLGGPVLLTPFADLPPATAALLREWRPTTVGVLGSTAVVSTRVEQQVRALSTTTTRTGGRDRYETAAQTYYGAYTFESDVPALVDGLRTGLLTSGQQFADAMTAAPVAAAETLPLLLTASDRLPAATRAALEYDGGSDTGLEQVIVVGGPSAVSDAVLREVEGLGLEVRRVSGADRQATAIAVFALAEQEFGWDLDHVHLARGDGFADAVAVGAHAGVEQAPVLLTLSADELGSTTRDFLLSRRGTIASLDVVGGAAAVGEDVVADVRAAASR